MRLSLLLEREPFGSILEETLSMYWGARFSAPVTVRWEKPAKGDQVWRGNIYLNFFCVEGVDKACFDVIVREFGHARAAWRRGLQSAYVAAATHGHTRRWLSQVCFGVSAEIPRAKEILIIGGNRRIRMIHPRAGRSIVIHKTGYTRQAFDREVVARLGPAAALAPTFYGLDSGGGAFEEEYFVGTPANRLSVLQERDVRQKALVSLVDIVHRPTLRVVSLAARLLETSDRLQAMVIGLGEDWRQRLDAFAIQLGQAPVGLAFTHGDFQDANILITGSTIRIIDWETSAERSQFYDLATMESRLRMAVDRESTLVNLAERWVRDNSLMRGLLIPAAGRIAKIGHLALWWLEDMVLRAEGDRMCLRGLAKDTQHEFLADLSVLMRFLDVQR